MEFDFESESNDTLDVENPRLLLEHLNDITDSFANFPLYQASTRSLPTLFSFLKNLENVPFALIPRIFDIAFTALSNHSLCFKDENKSLFPCWVSFFGRLIHKTDIRCTQVQDESEAPILSSQTMPKPPRSTKRPKKSRKLSHSNGDSIVWQPLKLHSLQNLREISSLPLSQYFTNSQKETIISSIATCLSEILQNKQGESWKDPSSIELIEQTYADCILKHGHDAISSIDQNLRFFEFLAEPMASLLAFLEKQPTPSLVVTDFLVRFAQTEFSDSTHVKSAATFLSTFLQRSSSSFLRHLVYIRNFFDCPEFQLRSVMVESLGDCISRCLQATLDESNEAQIPKLLDLLIERFKDSSSPTRRKILQVIEKKLLYPVLYPHYPKHWMQFFKYTASRLLDKTQPVRSAAIKTFGAFLWSHPFQHHGGSLEVEFIRPELEKIKSSLSEMLSNTENMEGIDQKVLGSLETQFHYLTDLLEFATSIQDSIPIFVQLLASKSKVEVLETIDFFVAAVHAQVPKIQKAIGSMWHLVYNVRNVDYVNDIHDELLKSFLGLYIGNSSPEVAVKKLVKLTYNSSLADRTCLERILIMCMEKEAIEPSILHILWSLFSTQQSSIPTQQRRGAGLLLSWMITTSQLESASHLAMLLKVLKAKEDFPLLTYACKILQSYSGKLHPTSELLQSLLPLFYEFDAPDPWYPFAQMAIRTIYIKCTQPLLLLNQVIEELAPNSAKISAVKLSHFCFVLGQIAIQHLVYLEQIESNYKKSRAPAPKEDQSGLDNVVGSVEDVFTENMHAIRELEMLHGPNSLLAKYAPLVLALAERSTGSLKVFATTCMVQFMCVSMQFCDTHLPQLLRLAQPPYTFPLSANLMIAFGDLTVSFPTVMSNSNGPLYEALGSEVHLRVKKNALMVLLHLILNGMVKVKGQLGPLALCLEDPDPNIRGLAQLFFTELASKDHALANQFTDVLSYLLGYHKEEVVRNVLKMLFSCLVVPREKFFEGFLDKLGIRFREAGGHPRLWRDLMYCVSLINVESSTEMKVRKLMEYFPYIVDKLTDDSVHKSLVDWLSRALKACPNSLIIVEFLDKVKQKKEDGPEVSTQQ